MLHIAITCGEGFASGFLANRLNDLIKQEHLQDIATFVRIPYPELHDRQDEVDIAMILPHIEPKVVADKNTFNIPLYIIPFKAVAGVKAEAFIEDAEDILAIAHGTGGIQRFPEELSTARICRMISHRDFYRHEAR